MGLRSPNVPFSQMDQRQSDQYARSVPVVPDTGSTGSDQIKDGAVTEPKYATGSVSTRATADKAITNSKLRDSNALTVIGRPTGTNGSPSDIALDADNKFLVRRSGQLTGDTLQISDMPSGLATDTEVTAAIAAHVADSDPHPVYLTQTEGDGRYAQLGAANTFTDSQTVNATTNGSLDALVDNDSNGTANAARLVASSGDASGAWIVSGSGRTSALVTSGPTGAQGCLRTLGSYPLVFGTSNTYRGKIDENGFWFVAGLVNAANDAAAAAASVPVGAMYRNGSVLMVRVS